MTLLKEGEYEAIVTSIPDGKRGPYAVATAKGIDGVGSVTFSLEKTIWQEEKKPDIGDHVVLSGVHKIRHGWRAESARLLRLSDEKKAK